MPKHRKRKLGLAPGSLVATGEERNTPAQIRLISYQANQAVKDFTTSQLKECIEALTPDAIHWIDVNGTHDAQVVEELGQALQIHPLILEDILNPIQRTKIELHGDVLFTTPKMLSIAPGENVRHEAVSIVMGKNWILTFQEFDKPGDVWEPVRQRIKDPQGLFRKHTTADYLLYSLLDAIVDQYFIILDAFEDQAESLENKMVATLDNQTLREIQDLKSEMIRLRKSVWPLRDALGYIEKLRLNLIHPENIVYFRDVQDHLSSIIENIEIIRDLLSNSINTQISLLSNQMNQVMTTLAIISAFFIPLTFIVGVYGMNFKYMPELETKYGYFVVLGLMAFISLALFIVFKRKKWI